jgi:hypothetical protein
MVSYLTDKIKTLGGIFATKMKWATALGWACQITQAFKTHVSQASHGATMGFRYIWDDTMNG